MWRLELHADDEQIARIRAQAPVEYDGIRVTEFGNVWLLEAAMLSAATDAKVALDAGNVLLDQLNFAASLACPRHQAVPPASAVIDEHGRKSAFVTGSIAITLDPAASSATGNVWRPPPTTRERTLAELIGELAPNVPAIGKVGAVWVRCV